MNHHYTFESGVLEEECVALIAGFLSETFGLGKRQQRSRLKTTEQRLANQPGTHPLMH